METCKRFFGVLGILGVGLWVIFSANVFAQEGASTDSNAVVAEGNTESKKDWKQEISSDVQQIKENREANKSHAQAAIKEEKDLRDQIREAVQSGDHEKAKSLREQLKATREENIKERQQDLQNLKQVRQELKSDIKDARKDGALPPRGINPPGYNPPDRNQPGVGPGNPPGAGYGRPLPPDKSRMETFRDRREDIRDRREDIRDKREDIRDARHDNGRMDHVRDRRGDIRDPGKDQRDRRRDPRDHRKGDDGKRYLSDDKGNGRDNREKTGQNPGVRDHGAGVGTGEGQGGMHRPSDAARMGNGPRGGRGR